jgi:hypothetical protein
MRIYIRTSTHPSASTLAFDHEDFLNLQDEHWPIDGNIIAGDPYWAFKAILRKQSYAKLAADEGPTLTTFTLTRSRDTNCYLIDEIIKADADNTFFDDNDIEEISTVDNSVMHSFKRTTDDDISHIIRLKVTTEAAQTTEFLQKLEALLTEYNIANVNNVSVVVNDEVIFDAIEQASA